MTPKLPALSNGFFGLSLTFGSIWVSAWAQPVSPGSPFGEAREIPLNPGVAPGSENWSYLEVSVEGKLGPQVKNVVRPTLLYFPAEPDKSVEYRLTHTGPDAAVPNADPDEPVTTGPQAGQNVREQGNGWLIQAK